MRGYVESSKSFYRELLGYKPEATQLEFLDNNQWTTFCSRFGLNRNSWGIYLPRNQTAIVPHQIETAPLSLFHEYFGHGLYCEQSLEGRKLVELEKRLLAEEKQEFEGKQFTLEDVQKFRQRNSISQELQQLKKDNLGAYESFAIFTEYVLSRELDLMRMFEAKYDSSPKQLKQGIDRIAHFDKKYGDLATFYEFGLARRVTPERVRKLLEGIYGEKAVNQSRLILMTGSKKPFSDIDLFASSNFLEYAKNPWLDLIVFDEEDFERRVRLFEVQVTNPMLSGEIVSGDKNYLEQKKKQLREQPITEEAIQHNLRKSRETRLNSDLVEDPKSKEVLLSYSQTYLANAGALREGKRLLTREALLSSHSEKEKLLKGGIK